MTPQNEHLSTLQDIRSMMERSSRFISLSGLSGVAAGIFALAGAMMAYIYLDFAPFESQRLYYIEAPRIEKWGMGYLEFFLLDAFVVLVCAIIAGVFFTTRKAKKKGQKIWGPLSKRLLINLLIPLVTGGIFCFALLQYGALGLIAPATLVFYGLALVNASKYTLHDLRNLGLSEIVLGLIALLFPGYGLDFWAIGFGILHIFYGAMMYNKYEKKP